MHTILPAMIKYALSFNDIFYDIEVVPISVFILLFLHNENKFRDDNLNITLT